MKYPATHIKYWVVFIILLLFYKVIYSQCPTSAAVAWQGNAVVKKTAELSKGNNVIWVDEELSALPPDPYIVEVSSSSFTQRIKAIKQ